MASCLHTWWTGKRWYPFCLLQINILTSVVAERRSCTTYLRSRCCAPTVAWPIKTQCLPTCTSSNSVERVELGKNLASKHRGLTVHDMPLMASSCQGGPFVALLSVRSCDTKHYVAGRTSRLRSVSEGNLHVPPTSPSEYVTLRSTWKRSAPANGRTVPF